MGGAGSLSHQPTAGRRIRWQDYASSIEPKDRDALKFEQRGGLLRNILTRQVPALAAEHGLRVLEQVLSAADRISPICQYLDHARRWPRRAAGHRTTLWPCPGQTALQRRDPPRVRQSVERLCRISCSEAALADKALQGGLVAVFFRCRVQLSWGITGGGVKPRAITPEILDGLAGT